MSADEDTELRDLIYQSLEQNGIIGKIKAELRATIFMSLEEDGCSFKDRIPLVNQGLKKFLTSENALKTVSLIRDFLKFFGMKYTLSVFEPEMPFESSESSFLTREELLKEFNCNETDEPILAQLVRDRKSDYSGTFESESSRSDPTTVAERAETDSIYASSAKSIETEDSEVNSVQSFKIDNNKFDVHYKGSKFHVDSGKSKTDKFDKSSSKAEDNFDTVSLMSHKLDAFNTDSMKSFKTNKFDLGSVRSFKQEDNFDSGCVMPHRNDVFDFESLKNSKTEKFGSGSVVPNRSDKFYVDSVKSLKTDTSDIDSEISSMSVGYDASSVKNEVNSDTITVLSYKTDEFDVDSMKSSKTDRSYSDSVKSFFTGRFDIDSMKSSHSEKFNDISETSFKTDDNYDSCSTKSIMTNYSLDFSSLKSSKENNRGAAYDPFYNDPPPIDPYADSPHFVFGERIKRERDDKDSRSSYDNHGKTSTSTSRTDDALLEKNICRRVNKEKSDSSKSKMGNHGKTSSTSKPDDSLWDKKDTNSLSKREKSDSSKSKTVSHTSLTSLKDLPSLGSKQSVVSDWLYKPKRLPRLTDEETISAQFRSWNLEDDIKGPFSSSSEYMKMKNQSKGGAGESFGCDQHLSSSETSITSNVFPSFQSAFQSKASNSSANIQTDEPSDIEENIEEDVDDLLGTISDNSTSDSTASRRAAFDYSERVKRK